MSEHETTVSPRADLIGGLAWAAFGIAIVVASWTMDRLEQFGATLYTAPGLVPGLLGAAIALLGVVLTIRAIRRGAIAALAAPWSTTPEGRASRIRVAIATVLSLAYALILVGRIPFPVATAVFVFAFIMVFDVSDAKRSPLLRRALVAAIAAVATAAVVSLTFERVFLVRLP
jgi:putative tricarboxylic transport membrane protein